MRDDVLTNVNDVTGNAPNIPRGGDPNQMPDVQTRDPNQVPTREKTHTRKPKDNQPQVREPVPGPKPILTKDQVKNVIPGPKEVKNVIPGPMNQVKKEQKVKVQDKGRDSREQ